MIHYHALHWVAVAVLRRAIVACISFEGGLWFHFQKLGAMGISFCFFFFPNDFCEWGKWDRGALQDRARVLGLCDIWQVFCSPGHSLPSQALLSLFGVLAFFIFLQLSPFTIQLIISNLWHSISLLFLAWLLLSLFISSSCDKALVYDNSLVSLWISNLAIICLCYVYLYWGIRLSCYWFRHFCCFKTSPVLYHPICLKVKHRSRFIPFYRLL